jgi:hypothetical protein
VRERLSGYWAFALALSAAPLSYLAAAPCGLLCGSCPLGGACLVASPLVFGMVILIKTGKAVLSPFRRLYGRMIGREEPPQARTHPPSFIRIDDAEE